MKKRVFIIHGWDGNPNEAWLKWLREELEKRNFEVISPQLPNADKPEIKEWVLFLSDLVGEPNEQDFFVGHSIGCQTIMRYLEKIYPKKIKGAVFVAGWFDLSGLETNKEKEIAEPWLKTPIDFEKIKRTTSDFIAIFSDNDPFVELDKNKRIFEEKLGASVVLEKNKGHFTEDDGVTKLPSVMQSIEKLAK